MIRIKLAETLVKLKVSRYELAKRTKIRYQVIDNYYKNKIKDMIVMSWIESVKRSVATLAI